MCLFDHLLYLHLLRQFRVFCDVNSTSYSLCPLKDGRGSDRPRRRIFSGIHRRCHRDKARPPPLSKKKKNLACCHTIWRIVPISFPLYQMQCVSSRTFCSIYHMRFGLLCGDANFVTFWYLGECCLTSFCHSHFFPFSLSTSKHIFYPIDWLAYIKPLSSWQNFIWIFSTFPVSFNQQLSATSTLDTLCARQS